MPALTLAVFRIGGVSDKVVNTSVEWVDGTPTDYLDWKDGFPVQLVDRCVNLHEAGTLSLCFR